MKKNAWKKKIVESCEQAGTFRPYFLPVIETLAGILERRDDAVKMFEETGGNVLVKHTNKGGATNIEQNPALRLVNDLNRDALAYWRDLGLTPAGLRKINDKAMDEGKKKKSGLSSIMADLLKED